MIHDACDLSSAAWNRKAHWCNLVQIWRIEVSTDAYQKTEDGYPSWDKESKLTVTAF